MAPRTRARSRQNASDEPPLTAREAVDLVREYITEAAETEHVRMTSVVPTDAGGWIVEVEIVEDRRIPSSGDILALYEVELDATGELLAYQRTRRYMRGQMGNGGGRE